MKEWFGLFSPHFFLVVQNIGGENGFIWQVYLRMVGRTLPSICARALWFVVCVCLYLYRYEKLQYVAYWYTKDIHIAASMSDVLSIFYESFDSPFPKYINVHYRLSCKGHRIISVDRFLLLIQAYRLRIAYGFSWDRFFAKKRHKQKPKQDHACSPSVRYLVFIVLLFFSTPHADSYDQPYCRSGWYKRLE